VYRDVMAEGSISMSKAGVIATLMLSILAGAAYAADWQSPVRTALGVAFLFLAPGLAVVELLAIEDPLMRIALVPGISIAVGTLVAVSLVYADAYSPGLALALLEALTLATLLAAVLRRGALRFPAAGSP
jgi:uncharacterized membrane protein